MSSIFHIPRTNNSEVDTMKIIVVILCFFCTTVAFAQVAALGASTTSAEPQPLQFFSHPAHATHKPMGREESLLQPSAYFTARGERPLWEVANLPEAVPLGDIARALREERDVLKKSEVVWVNQ
jgi:hypothetical protein